MPVDRRGAVDGDIVCISIAVGAVALYLPQFKYVITFSTTEQQLAVIFLILISLILVFHKRFCDGGPAPRRVGQSGLSLPVLSPEIRRAFSAASNRAYFIPYSDVPGFPQQKGSDDERGPGNEHGIPKTGVDV